MASKAERSAVESAAAGARASSTGWHRTNCPCCLTRTGKSDYKGALAINARTGVFKCWKCSLKGRMSGKFEDFEREEEVAPIKMEPPEHYVTLASHEGQTSFSLEPAREYAAKRCDPSMWFEIGIGGCARGYYAGRVIVPIYDLDDQTWAGWVGRTWYPSEKAYTYPKGMNRAAMLYNPRAVYADTEEPLLVVEGVFDAIHLWPNAVAILGKASEPQMEALASSNRPIVMVLDGDAWMEGWSMAAVLKLRGRVAGSVRLPPTLDPDEVPRDWLDEEIRRAY